MKKDRQLEKRQQFFKVPKFFRTWPNFATQNFGQVRKNFGTLKIYLEFSLLQKLNIVFSKFFKCQNFFEPSQNLLLKNLAKFEKMDLAEFLSGKFCQSSKKFWYFKNLLHKVHEKVVKKQNFWEIWARRIDN